MICYESRNSFWNAPKYIIIILIERSVIHTTPFKKEFYKIDNKTRKLEKNPTNTRSKAADIWIWAVTDNEIEMGSIR